MKVSFWKWGFPDQLIDFVAKSTITRPGLCLPQVNSCGSHSWKEIRRRGKDRCWSRLTISQQQQFHMFEITLWLFQFDSYCVFGLNTCHSCCEAKDHKDWCSLMSHCFSTSLLQLMPVSQKVEHILLVLRSLQFKDPVMILKKIILCVSLALKEGKAYSPEKCVGKFNSHATESQLCLTWKW